MATYPDARGMPGDVGRFMIRWADCQHFLSEPAFDKQRGRDLDRAVKRVCPGIDAEGASVRARYAQNRQIIDKLGGYEPLGQ